MAKVAVTSDMNMYPAEVAVQTLWQAAEMVRKGALTNQIMQAAYERADRQFNEDTAVAAASSKDGYLSHVFDFGGTQGVGPRLWKTIMAGNGSYRTVSFVLLPSRRKVPIPEELQPWIEDSYVFKNKADYLESAKPVTVRLRKKKVLVFLRDSAQGRAYMASGRAKLPKGAQYSNVAFSKGPVYIRQSEDGKYKNQFYNHFVTWWATMGQREVGEVAEFLEKSFTVRSARTAAARTRIEKARKTAVSKSATPEAKRRAEKIIADVRRDMTEHGRKTTK